tara:strand:- start:380 stop:655 length:276 start_codon:yes stop_codon:yes gene_type:complete
LDDKTPNLIKIDVEGHEVKVLQGGTNTLLQAKLIIESFPPKQKTVLSILQELGYKSMDTDSHSPLNLKTNNLFAWHPRRILKETIIQKLIH